MSDDVILLSSPVPHIALITLNRPEKRNALDGNTISTLHHLLDQLEQDKQIHVVIFNGNGEHFCAGADLAWMQKMANASQDENVQDALQLATLMQRIYCYTKPTIALAHGNTMGGGLGIVASCDISFASDDALFCFSETKIGLTPSVISPYVISAIGERVARYYFLTAERFTAQRAYEINLVHHTVHKDKLFECGMAAAQSLLKNSQAALGEAKKLIRHVIGNHSQDDLKKWTANHLATMRMSDDAQARLTDFLTKKTTHKG